MKSIPKQAQGQVQPDPWESLEDIGPFIIVSFGAKMVGP